MASNGVILLNLNNRNAAEFSRLEVPGSYDKALGALTAGTYINVYKWQYQGFALTASICTVTDETLYLLLTDKSNGGTLRVYPDDTIYLESETPSVSDTGEFALKFVTNTSAVVELYYGVIYGDSFYPAYDSARFISPTSYHAEIFPGFVRISTVEENGETVGWRFDNWSAGLSLDYYYNGNWHELSGLDNITIGKSETIIFKYKEE